eukprot:1160695-Pelagomonas_calceolata.AAC.4
MPVYRALLPACPASMFLFVCSHCQMATLGSHLIPSSSLLAKLLCLHDQMLHSCSCLLIAGMHKLSGSSLPGRPISRSFLALILAYLANSLSLFAPAPVLFLLANTNQPKTLSALGPYYAE